MAKRLLTECPYCHRKVSYFGAGILKTKGEHDCSGCKCISNVVIHRALYGIAGGAVVLSLIFLLTFSAYMEHDNIWGIILVLSPFLIFYILAPFFIKLEPCNDKSAVNKLRRKIDPVPPERKQPVKKQEQPIELDVGDQFSSSFMKAKSSIKFGEDGYSEEYAEDLEPIVEVKDINSGVDIDISASVGNETDNFPGNETKEEYVDDKTDDISAEFQSDETISQQISGEVVPSAYEAQDSTETPEKVENSATPKGNEVSFIFGRINDDDDI